MTETNNYLPVHLDLYDTTLRDIVENALNKETYGEVLKTHRVSGIVRLNDNRWIVRLEYSVAKAAGFGNDR